MSGERHQSLLLASCLLLVAVLVAPAQGSWIVSDDAAGAIQSPPTAAVTVSGGPASMAPRAAPPAADAEAAALDSMSNGKPMRWLVTYRVAADGGSPADDPTTQPEPSAAAAAPASDAALVAPAAAAARLRAQDSAKYRVLAPDGPAAAAGARLVQHYSHLPVSAVELTDVAALAALRAHPDVARVEPDRPNVLALQQSLPLINQPAAAAAGDAGAGCFVAVVDGVVDATHPDLGACSSPGAPPPCRVALAKDFSSTGSSGPAADTSHGTNVASIVARTAPGSLILALNVLEANTQGSTIAWDSSLLAAVNWAVQAKSTGAYNVCAINLSITSNSGGFYPAACGDSAFEASFAAARVAGVLPVVASGNNAKKDGLPSPACAPSAVSVGASFDAAASSRSWGPCTDAAPVPDGVACFSNGAPYLTMLAPGAFITAGGWSMAGTSQAAPHVAGAAAVLKAAVPAATAAQIVAALQGSGVKLSDPLNGVTTPRVNLAAAVVALQGGTYNPGAGDAAPPTGAVRIQGGAATTPALDVTLTISGQDPGGSGVASMCVMNEPPPAAPASACAPYEAFAQSKAWRLANGANGPRTVGVFLRDAAGNTMAAPATATIQMVTQTTTLVINGGAQYTVTRAVTLIISAPGATPKTRMCVTSSAGVTSAGGCTSWTAYAQTKRVTLSASPQGPRTVTVFFWDPANGGTTRAPSPRDPPPASATIVLDTAAPVMQAASMALTATPSGGGVAVGFQQAATDAASGVASYVIVGRQAATAPSRCTGSYLNLARLAGLSGQTAAAPPSPPAGSPAGAAPQSVAFAGLKPASAYAFRVCAVDAAGNTAVGTTVQTKTSA